MGRALRIAVLLACVAAPVLGTALAAEPLPSLALDPQPAPSPWHGFWVGTDIVAVSRSGGKGFVGGDVTGGYDHAFADGTLLSLRGASGVAPGWSSFGLVRPYEFASMGASVAYPMGRWTPYLTTDLVLARPNDRLSDGFRALDASNDLLNGAGKLDVGGTVGAGFNYALTNTTSVGLGVSVHRGTASVFP